MSAVMLDQDHVEIKAVIGLNLLAFEQEQIDNITDTCEEPLDMEQLQKRPGLVGYIAKDGDSLWSIAKRITQRWKIFCGIITGRMRICAEEKKF